MRTESIKTMITLATALNHPISVAVLEAKEVGVIVPSILQSKLEALGYEITYHEGPDGPEGDAKHGAWVRVSKADTIIARAYSHDRGDALIQAILGWLKEQ